MVKSVGKRRWLPNAMSWVKVRLTNEDGTEAQKGTYRVEFGDKWYPQEALVDAGESEIPLRRVGDGAYQLKPNTLVGCGGVPLEEVNLDEAQIGRGDEYDVHVVDGDKKEVPDDEPPQEVMSTLNTAQQAAFRRLWQRVPAHIRDVHFDFNAALWSRKILMLWVICCVSSTIVFRRTVQTWGG